MEINQEFIDNLKIDENALMKRIAESLAINQGQVIAVVELLHEGATVPFIARYRKEKHGGLDEVQVRNIEHGYNAGRNLEERRTEIVRLIFEQGKLTGALYGNIAKAATLAELEDLYAPYKRKKKTRGMAAVEKGLEPLAEAMRELETERLVAKAAEFVREDAEHPELSVASVADALQGAMDIIAEQTAQTPEHRAAVKAFYHADGVLIVKASQKPGVGDDEAKKTSPYQMYWDYTEKLSQIKPHRILAINRGEREKALETRVDVDENAAVDMLQKKCLIHNEYHKTAIEDGLKRLLSPAVIREIRGDQGDVADDHGISVFSTNLKHLLMQQPIKGTRVLGIDPGIRTGTKCACLDETGKFLHYFTFMNNQTGTAKALLLKNMKEYHIRLVAVGGGTGTKDVQELVTQVIAENGLDVLYTVVDEDGASVYSASDIAREEFPDLDLTIRGAISIGRRLQDPLAELVKIDPKSIGVGLYQHDINQKKLSDTLDEVVSSVVNNVGVNLNTASVSLLKYVSGINASLAKKIVKHRDEKGKITSRDELNGIQGMGPKTFEQCAGFLKIPEGAEPLDNTWVHPENYAIARAIRNTITITGGISSETAKSLKEQFGVGDATINDIIDELKKPGRDPREEYPKPIMRSGVVTFEDLKEGMTVTGKIKNVVDFGAFVDVGIKETALVHISELSDHFVQDPMDVVKVGEVYEFHIIGLDTDRRRISLSRRSGQSAPLSGAPQRELERPAAKSGAADGKKRVVIAKKAGGAPSGSGDHAKASRSSRYASEDDGAMYNPFAAAFQKMEKKRVK
ncbi:MAG: RNA-binding transcriptional accessory protein [Treponema sp.]|jgi:uncharacterized protein|nr:RNA-binding transcriptional accessory protein [Treponema sp.]